jgi:hypothetical protein
MATPREKRCVRAGAQRGIDCHEIESASLQFPGPGRLCRQRRQCHDPLRVRLQLQCWLELQWYMFAIFVMFGASYTFKKNEHVGLKFSI